MLFLSFFFSSTACSVVTSTGWAIATVGPAPPPDHALGPLTDPMGPLVAGQETEAEAGYKGRSWWAWPPAGPICGSGVSCKPGGLHGRPTASYMLSVTRC